MSTSADPPRTPADQPRPYEHFIDRLVKADSDELPLFSASWWQRRKTPMKQHFVMAVLEEAALQNASAVCITIGARVLFHGDGLWYEIPPPPRQFVQDWFVWAAKEKSRRSIERVVEELEEVATWSKGRLYVGASTLAMFRLASHATGLPLPGHVEEYDVDVLFTGMGRQVLFYTPDDPAVPLGFGAGPVGEGEVHGTLHSFTEAIQFTTAFLGGESLGDIDVDWQSEIVEGLPAAYRDLRHPNPWVRQEAAIMLRYPERLLGGERSFEVACELIGCLQDIDPDVRYQVAETLGRLGFDEAVDPLESQARHDPNPHVREACKSSIQALRKRWLAS